MAFIQSSLAEIASPDQTHKFVRRWDVAGVAKRLARYRYMAKQVVGREVAGLGVYWMGENSGGDALMAFADPVGAMNDAGNLLHRTVEQIRQIDFTVKVVPHGQVWQQCELPTICKRDWATKRDVETFPKPESTEGIRRRRSDEG